MSRHRNLRRFGEDEMYDQYDDEDCDEESRGAITELQRAQLEQGYQSVRAMIPEEDTGITRREIEDTLWYYYFDAEKSVEWLLEKVIKSAKQKKSSLRKTQETQVKANKGEYSRRHFIGRMVTSRAVECRAVQSRSCETCTERGTRIDWASIARRSHGPRLGMCGLLGGSGVVSNDKDMKGSGFVSASSVKETIIVSATEELDELFKDLDSMPSNPAEKDSLHPFLLKKNTTSSSSQPVNTRHERPLKGFTSKLPTSDITQSSPDSVSMEFSPFVNPLFGSPSTLANSLFEKLDSRSCASFPSHLFEGSSTTSDTAFKFDVLSPDSIVLAAQTKAGKAEKQK